MHAPLPRLTRQRMANPERALRQWLPAAAAGDVLLVDFEIREYWQEPAAVRPLVALFEVTGEAGGPGAVVRCTVRAAQELPAAADLAVAQVAPLLANALTLGAPLCLRPVSVPKPWGQEIWYTGIERRGVAAVAPRPATGAEEAVPLPWLLAALPESFPHALPPVLLKILDPLPEEVFGDLYFELHREKREVYVVSAVDRRAWPDGRGAIRMGFDADLRREYADDARFRTDFAAAVKAYEAVRREIDQCLEPLRAAAGYGSNDPVPAVAMRGWLEDLPQALRQTERERRRAMERFTRLQPLDIGDVVRVPRLQPHALQHGVRAVEFQTPVYERLIVSFAQKVLTQPHWDTDEAVRLMHLDPEPEPAPELLAQGEGWRDERIVDFDDFEVQRIRLDAGASRTLPGERNYAVAMAVGGTLTLGSLQLAAEQAALIPRAAELLLHNPGPAPAALLWARPRG